MAIKVAVSGRFKGKICSSSLCGNNNGNRRDDNQYSRKCAPPQKSCIPSSVTQPIIDKCHLMNSPSSPFRTCNRLVDPTTLISDCKYDACRCTNPMQCVCASFATYSKQCAGYGAIIDWRFKGTKLYEPLKECGKEYHKLPFCNMFALHLQILCRYDDLYVKSRCPHCRSYTSFFPCCGVGTMPGHNGYKAT